MPLISCPECNKEVSDQATSCPGCGYPLARKKMVAQGAETVSAVKSQMQSAANMAGSVAKDVIGRASRWRKREDEYVQGASGVEWTDGDRRLFGWMRYGLLISSILLGLLAFFVSLMMSARLAESIRQVGGAVGESFPLGAFVSALWHLLYCIIMPLKYWSIMRRMKSKIQGSFKRARRWYIIDVLLFICGNLTNPVCWVSFVMKFISYRKVTRSIAIQSVYSDEWYA